MGGFGGGNYGMDMGGGGGGGGFMGGEPESKSSEKKVIDPFMVLSTYNSLITIFHAHDCVHRKWEIVNP